jgi:hypothetical protein
LTEALTGSVACEKCGTLMDSRTNESFLSYERISGDERPTQKALATPTSSLQTDPLPGDASFQRARAPSPVTIPSLRFRRVREIRDDES